MLIIKAVMLLSLTLGRHHLGLSEDLNTSITDRMFGSYFDRQTNRLDAQSCEK